MAEYIEREAMQAALVRKQCGPANKLYVEGWNDCLMLVKSMVSTIPAANFAPVMHGNWAKIKSGRRGYYIFRCTACNSCSPFISKYCPDCGAKMDLE